MPKVRWVMLYKFCSTCQSYREFKGGNFFEIQCRYKYHLPYLLANDVSHPVTMIFTFDSVRNH